MNEFQGITETQNKKNLRFKDLSDWIKVGVLIVSMFVAGTAAWFQLKSEVSVHTSQLQMIQQQNARTNEVLNRIELYLSSKDPKYWQHVTPKGPHE